MERENKYDVMSDSVKGLYSLGFKLSLKLISTMFKVITNKIDSEGLEVELGEIYIKTLPYAVKVSHINYENNKDLKSIDEIKLIKYLENKNVNIEEYKKNYSNSINNSIKLLLLCALMEKSNVDLFSNNQVIEFLNGYSVDIINTFDQLSEEDQCLLDTVMQKDYDTSQLSEELIELIDKYHDKYMNEQIYPNVTEENISQKDIMKWAKKFGKRKNRNNR